MAATSTSDSALATAAVNSNDGPVLSVINKRIRALRKKQNRITQMEEALSQGKTLNKEQQEVLRSKPGLVAVIDELEKLRSPISTAVEEEIALAVSQQTCNRQEQQTQDEVAAAAGEEVEQHGPAETVNSEESPAVGEDAVANVEDLLNLLYFGSLFDVMAQSEFTSTMLTRTHERSCCLTYDIVTEDATDLLSEHDLDLIAGVKGMLTSRPVDSSLSHKNALQRCTEHAKLWLAKSDQPIYQASNVTYAALREKLCKILSSDYYTTSPEMKAPADMAVFGSFQAPLHGSVMPMSMPAQVEDSFVQYKETGHERNTSNIEEYVTNDNHQDALVDQNEKDLLEKENPQADVVSGETAQFEHQHYQEEQNPRDQQHDQEEQNPRDQQYQEEQNPSDMDLKDQQPYGSRRYYHNQRGGRGGSIGRRGYSNGRGGRGSSGGRGYQNGGRGQYYDQPRGHYRGRGGRGGGNNYYSSSSNQPHNSSSQMQGGGHGHAQSSMGAASS